MNRPKLEFTSLVPTHSVVSAVLYVSTASMANSASHRPDVAAADPLIAITFRQSAAPAAVGEESAASWMTVELASNRSPSVAVLNEALDLAVAAYATPVIVAFGLAANVLCCLALRAARFQPAASALLLGLVAAGDSLALVLNLLEYTVPSLMLQRVFFDFYFSSGALRCVVQALCLYSALTESLHYVRIVLYGILSTVYPTVYSSRQYQLLSTVPEVYALHLLYGTVRYDTY